MSRYLLIGIIPLIFFWRSWVSTPCAPDTTTTTTAATTITTTTLFDTFILTSTIPPTTTLIVTAWEEHRLADERRMLQNQEFDEQLKHQRLVWQQDREAEEAAAQWDEKMRDSWLVWFMDCCFCPLAYLLVSCVAVRMLIRVD
jgi:hypothetical protein